MRLNELLMLVWSNIPDNDGGTSEATASDIDKLLG